MVGAFREPSCGRRTQPIHSIPYSVAQPLERGSNNYYSIIQGELLSESDLGIGSEYVTTMWMWEGKGSIGANANVMFQDGKVVNKAQFGLE